MDWFDILLWIWITIPIIIFPVLLKIKVPYGRHTTSGWGPMIDNHWGWFWMEIPALLTFPLLAILGPTEKDALSWILIALWTIHYINRVFIFPFRIRTKGKKMPLIIAMSAIFFNLINGCLQREKRITVYEVRWRMASRSEAGGSENFEEIEEIG